MLIHHVEVAASPIVGPILPVPSLPFQEQYASSTGSSTTAPSQTTSASNRAPTKLFKDLYHRTQACAVVTDASTSAPVPNTNTDDVVSTSHLDTIYQMLESLDDLAGSSSKSTDRNIHPRALVIGGAHVPIPQGMGKNELDLWWDLSHTALPIRPGDTFILWTGKVAGRNLDEFGAKIEHENPGSRAWTSNDFVTFWKPAFVNYIKAQKRLFPKGSNMPWITDTLLSMKIAETISKYECKVHVLYSKMDSIDMPQGTLLAGAEMPIVTSQGSRVTEIYRWEAGTFQLGAFHPERIWQNSDAQMGSIIKDLRINPRFIQGKGMELENSQELDFPDFDFENLPSIDQARSNLNLAVSNMALKAQNGAISEKDLQSTLSASEDLYLAALKTIKDNGQLTSEAENAIAEYSPLNNKNSLVADPVADRFRWNLPDAALDNEILLKGKLDGKGNFVGSRHNKVSIENFVPSTPDAASIAKVQIASFGIAKHLMDPKQFTAQTPATQQNHEPCRTPCSIFKTRTFWQTRRS
jgi:hypothetical protein